MSFFSVKDASGFYSKWVLDGQPTRMIGVFNATELPQPLEDGQDRAIIGAFSFESSGLDRKDVAMLIKKNLISINLRSSGLIGLLLLIALYLPSSALAAANPPVPRTSPDDVVRQFYGWYLKAGFPQPKRSNLATFRKYITQKFLKRAMDPEVDSVLFIDAQDDDSTWANNFNVTTATLQGQTATTEVTLTGKTVHYKLIVTLRRENGVWKIDGVKGKDWKDVTSG